MAPRPILRSGVFSTVSRDPKLLHVRPSAGGWEVCADVAQRPLSRHYRREDALALATALARRSGAEVRVLTEDGAYERHVDSLPAATG